MKFLITGSNGLLGQKIVQQLRNKQHEFIATSQGENRNSNCPNERYFSLDITDENAVHEFIQQLKPTHIIHTAALTNVDECELNPTKCQRINLDGTRFLFEAAKSIGAHFEFLSTDFVFDGEKGNYSEEDKVNPLSVYAQSKVDGENTLIQSDYKNWSIARTIIVYGTAENLSRSNLLVWAKSALPKGEPMKIIDDQFRAPTWADDLAWGCIRICALNKTGIFHLSGPSTQSIYQIVEEIANHYNWSMSQVEKISSSELNQPAKRPPKTGFNLSKAKNELGYCPKSIKETLDLF